MELVYLGPKVIPLSGAHCNSYNMVHCVGVPDSLVVAVSVEDKVAVGLHHKSETAAVRCKLTAYGQRLSSCELL